MENEQELIERCKAGDQEAFGGLYDAYIKKIYNFCYYKTLHKETAEDITAIVFTKAFEKIRSFSAEQGTFNSWVYAIARNSIVDHYRSQKHEKNIDDIWDLSSGEDIAADTDVRRQMEKVREYMAELSPLSRDMVIMKLWEGFTHAEIAEALGKTESAVKVAYSRAMKEIRSRAGSLASFAAFFALLG
ncbi:MAG: RNA polymerase sigma factor [Patescibacteria group bacterium]|nr:RNA polymerase sigma factor [bacterium]MDZ4221600.1 RNA polymerase sigma factor [Patescibacteria group bacterium]